MSDSLLDSPVFIFAMCVVMLVALVLFSLWLDNRPKRKQAKREAMLRRRERNG